MSKFTEDNTLDNEFHVLGSRRKPERDRTDSVPACEEQRRAGSGVAQAQKRGKAGWWKIASAIGLALLIIAILFILLKLFNTGGTTKSEPYYYEPVEETAPQVQEEIQAISSMQENDGKAFTELATRTVNDILLDIYIPHNASAELKIGKPDKTDKKIIFAAQAADIRADNGKIVGAFVLKGKPFTWGISKKGYCAMIEDQITIGVADNSPLFEKATETEGYFFRQYPLVSDGMLIENEPKGKSVRKAVCERNGEIMVIVTATPESYHDFSQALVDLGVNNAISLVGSEYSYGFCRDAEDNITEFAHKSKGSQRYENYLIWRATE